MRFFVIQTKYNAISICFTIVINKLLISETLVHENRPTQTKCGTKHTRVYRTWEITEIDNGEKNIYEHPISMTINQLYPVSIKYTTFATTKMSCVPSLHYTVIAIATAIATRSQYSTYPIPEGDRYALSSIDVMNFQQY